ncbi:MAG: four helix bundle protein [Gemmatimonadaceae bacterium]|nr:four helix bundle protein [Gemmatimonadaceae bacterium]
MTLPHLSFADFELRPPDALDGDPIWNVRMFRMATYLAGRCSSDVARLGPRISLHQADQFVRAVGSVAANIAEGYSRSGQAEPLRFYTFALGSTREALSWIDTMGDAPWEPRREYQDLLVQIRRQLLTACRRMRPLAYRKPKGRHLRRPQE